jgi:hypothetical protein
LTNVLQEAAAAAEPDGVREAVLFASSAILARRSSQRQGDLIPPT